MRQVRRRAALTAIFAHLAGEAGFTLAPPATSKAATVLAQAERGYSSGDARLAVRLLNEAVTSQALRVAVISQPGDPATLATITAADIPAQIHRDNHSANDERPGQYL